jgi:pentatricopeptide repeat-containing protein PET309
VLQVLHACIATRFQSFLLFPFLPSLPSLRLRLSRLSAFAKTPAVIRLYCANRHQATQVMLERTSTCLESGGRKLLRVPQPCLRSRRTLHSAFWHHGASDLSLPGWWAACSAHNGGSGGSEDGVAKATPPGPSSGALLDFLYPEKTLTLLKQLSSTVSDTTTSRRRRHPQRPSARHYATFPRQPARDGAAGNAAAPWLSSNTKDPDALRKLRQLLRLREPGSGGQDQAWQLYNAIPASVLADGEYRDLRADLLEYLTMNDDPAVPTQVLHLFEELPTDHRRASSYRAAVAAYVSLRTIGPALQLLEDVPSCLDFDFDHLGIDLVLRRTITDEQWDLSLRVFRLYLQQKRAFGRVPIKTAISWGNKLPAIWRNITTLHRLEEYQDSLLSHVREYQHELQSSRQNEETLSLFLTTFVCHVMMQVLQDYMDHGGTVLRYFRNLFKELNELNIPTTMFYEHAIKQLLKLPSEYVTRDLMKLRIRLYEEHRQLCLDSSVVFRSQPSLNLLRNLIVHHCDHDQLAQAYSVIEDHRTFYPNEPMRAGLLRYLVHCFADHGDLVQAKRYVEDMKTHYHDQVDIKLLSGLPFACARQADVGGAIEQFNRIRDEFGLVPDAACWNILLLTYVRAEDLDGAIDCFNTLMGNNVQPDVVTFGTLLDLCAQRGDVEAFETLFSRAERMGIDLTQDVRARSGYVQVFLKAGDPEGAEAIAQGMLKSWQAGTLVGVALTHTWNLLIQHHALDRDIASARQRYMEMVNNNIPVDPWTYGSLMRALVEVKQTNAAYKILSKTMPQSKLQAHALHYAIVMTGFLKEGGGQVDLAVETYQRMIEEGVPQTVSSQEASIRTLGAVDVKNRIELKLKRKNYQLKDVEEAVEKMVAEAVQGQLVYRQPQHVRQRGSYHFGAPPQSFYGLLISLYALDGSYEMCQRLFRKAEEVAPNVDNYIVPMNLLTGTMEAQLEGGNHAEVARCWQLAFTLAGKLTKTISQAVQPGASALDPDSLVDPSVRARYEESRISNSHRNILHKAARLYLRSLIDPSNPNPNALQKAQSTMRDLLVEGYTLDVFSWNELVTALAERGRLVDAFAVCEEYLMPSFPGWRNLYPSYIRRDRRGYKWMELRHFEIKRTSIIPRYKTLIVLTSEYRRVKNDERNGIGYSEREGAWEREVLESRAPMTVRAIETMPRTNDGLQLQYFHNALY